MTAQSSSKGCFGTYFKYRLGVMKINFAMCCILNVLGLPLYSVAANVGFGGVVSEFSATARVFSMICIAALPAVAVFNALSSFDYYHKKDLTDTIGALPLSHKQRFFADLLAGLAVNAAPIIPCGIFCVIAFGSMQGKLRERYSSSTIGDLHTVSIGLYIAAAVLLVVIFTYLFSVLTSVCCGKVFHSVLFCVIAIVFLPLLCGGMALCFGNAVLGIDSREYFWKAAAFFPPAGILHLLLIAMDVPFSIGFDSDILEYLFASLGFAQILVYLILAAGIIAGAYFLSKRRLSESTGSAFAIKPMFWVLSGGLTAAITISSLGVTREMYLEFPYPVISAAAGLLVCLVTILFYPQKKRTFLWSLIVGAGSVAVIFASWLVIDKTGAFGARYYPKNPDKLEYITLNGTYKITDKNDIEAFTSRLNEELHDNPDYLGYGKRFGGFFVEAKKTNGKSIARNYTNEKIGEEIFRSLDGYVDYFFGELERDPEDWKAYVSYSTIASVSSAMAMRSERPYIPDEKIPELIQILHEEAKEKYDPNAKMMVEIVFTRYSDRCFPITEDYTRTIAFLSDMGDVSETDPGLTYLSIDYSIIGEDWEVLRVHVPFADKDDERVKELVALLEDCEGEEPLTNFRINAFVGTKEPAVTEKHKARILELMKQLAVDYLNE